MRFPSLATKTLPVDPEALVDELAKTLGDIRWEEGYVRVAVPGGDEVFLFLHQSKAHFAGALEEDRFVSRSFVDFFESLPGARAAEYAATDQAMLLCMAVPFRKAPSSQIPAGAATGEAIAAAIQASIQQTGGRDAVLAFRRGDAVSLALFRQGTPGWLYPAPGEPLPEHGTPGERIAGYVKAFDDVAVDVYDQVFLPAAEGAGKRLRSYLDEAVARALIPAGLVPAITVTMNNRIVYRYIMDRDEIRVGRGGDNELALDNLSVSRSHAKIRRKGDSLVIIDTDSENGVLRGAKRVKEAELRAGDRVDIGKYTLVYDHYAPRAQASQVNPLPSGRKAVEETLGMGGPAFRTASFVVDGDEHRMGGMVFHIGKANDAHLKIGGLFVAPIHVRVVREASTGAFKASHVAGARPMRINGEPQKEVVLKHGDEIEIAGTVVKFQLDASATQAKIGPR